MLRRGEGRGMGDIRHRIVSYFFHVNSILKNENKTKQDS